MSMHLMPLTDHPLVHQRCRETAARFQATLDVPRTDTYTLYTQEANDDLRVLVNGTQVLPLWYSSTNKKQHDVELQEGEQDLIVEYRNHKGGGKLTLEWEGPNLTRTSLDGFVSVSAWPQMNYREREAFMPQAERIAGFRARYYTP